MLWLAAPTVGCEPARLCERMPWMGGNAPNNATIETKVINTHDCHSCVIRLSNRIQLPFRLVMSCTCEPDTITGKFVPCSPEEALDFLVRGKTEFLLTQKRYRLRYAQRWPAMAVLSRGRMTNAGGVSGTDSNIRKLKKKTCKGKHRKGFVIAGSLDNLSQSFFSRPRTSIRP